VTLAKSYLHRQHIRVRSHYQYAHGVVSIIYNSMKIKKLTKEVEVLLLPEKNVYSVNLR